MDIQRTIHVYNQNCVMAGRQVPIRLMEQHDEEQAGSDWHEEELTEKNASYHDEKTSTYHAQIARTIRAAM